MTGLRDALIPRIIPDRPFPELGITAKLARALAGNTLAGMSRPTVDLDTVADRFLLSIRHGSEPSASDWNKITWCLWSTQPAVAEHDVALDAVLGRVTRMRRKRPYRQLASVYLADFSPDRPRLDRVAKVLAAYAPAAGDPWSRLQIAHGIFDGTHAISRLARILLREDLSIQRFMEAVGSGLAESGFAEAVHAEGLKWFQETPIFSAAERLDAVRHWSLRPNDTMIFDHCRGELARAVVKPFGDRVPATSDRDQILGFLVGRFGDPRVKPAPWIRMNDVAETIKRWLTEQSLRQFFDVVDRIAPDRAWRYRRAFWKAYHDASLIQNAWVVFGSDGAAEARRSFGKDVRFGVFKGGGRKQIQQGHAVLLLDFGQCVVADWSYNGFCNIWANADERRPKEVNGTHYTSDEIRRHVPADRSEINLTRHDIFAHAGSENYVWQDRVARRLHQLVGVRILQSAYRVR